MLSAKLIRSKARNYPQEFARVNGKFLPTAGAILEADARYRAPRDKGALKESLYNEVKGDVAIVGAAIDYAADVEYGTKPHTIEVNSPVYIKKAGGYRYLKTVNHPGTKAQPFMRPALDKNRKKLINLYRKMFRNVFSGIRGVQGG